MTFDNRIFADKKSPDPALATRESGKRNGTMSTTPTTGIVSDQHAAVKTEKPDYLSKLTELGMSLNTISYYVSSGLNLADVYTSAVHLQSQGVDLNANIPGSDNWKTPQEREKEVRARDEYKKLTDSLYNTLSRLDTLAFNGQSEAALRGVTQLLRKKHKPISQERLEAVMQEIGLSVRLNLITKRFEYIGWAASWPRMERGRLENDIPVKLMDLTQEIYTGVNDGTIRRLLGVIAGENCYNPVLDLIKETEVTQESYVGEWEKLTSALNIKTSFEETLLYKWFLQGIALLHNQGTKEADYSADGMLVLHGPQGCGKTSFVQCAGMRPEWYMTGSKVKPQDKDYLIRSTGRFITEYGEGERSFLKVDPDEMKAFVTQGTDFYRRPWDRADTEAARHTNFVATCNSTEFLVDLTGNRRFWIIDVTGMDVEALRKIDFLVIWRGTYSVWRDLKKAGKENDYRLTPEEREKLEEKNKPFMRPVMAQAECEDIFALVEQHPDLYTWDYMTITDFMSEWNDFVFGKRHFTSAVVGRALKALGHESELTRENGKTGRYIFLPRRK